MQQKKKHNAYMQHVIGRARLRTQLHFKQIVLYERGSSTS